jgi:hypothetical protein
VTELAAICAAVAAQGIRARSGRVLPRRGARLGGRLRPLAPRSHRRPARRLRCAHRSRSARDGPPERLRSPSSGHGSTATSISVPAGSGRPGLRHLLTHPSLAHVTYYLETPGMDDGFDAFNVARAYQIAAGLPTDGAAGRRRPCHERSLADRPARGRPEPAAGPGIGGPEWTASFTERRRAVLLAVPIILLVIAAVLGYRTWRRGGRGTRTRDTTCSLLRRFVQDGVVPLLGPPTSIGDVASRRALLLPPRSGPRRSRR